MSVLPAAFAASSVFFLIGPRCGLLLPKQQGQGRVFVRPDDPQTNRILGIVHTIALEAVELPPSRREAFIKEEIQDLRRHYRLKYRGDERKVGGALEFSDKLEEWVLDAGRLVEESGSKVGRA